MGEGRKPGSLAVQQGTVWIVAVDAVVAQSCECALCLFLSFSLPLLSTLLLLSSLLRYHCDGRYCCTQDGIGGPRGVMQS